MLYWVAVFLIIAIIAGALGFGGISAVAASIAKVIFFIAITLFVIGVVVHTFRKK